MQEIVKKNNKENKDRILLRAITIQGYLLV